MLPQLVFWEARPHARRLIAPLEAHREAHGIYPDAVEPLAYEFAERHGITDLRDKMDFVHSVAAEQFIPGWEGSVDFVWSHNCLDHCWSWRRILDNVDRYLRPGGAFYIGTDADQPPTVGHPGVRLSELVAHVGALGWDVTQTHMKQDDDPVWIRTLGIRGFKVEKKVM